MQLALGQLLHPYFAFCFEPENSKQVGPLLFSSCPAELLEGLVSKEPCTGHVNIIVLRPQLQGGPHFCPH